MSELLRVKHVTFQASFWEDIDIIERQQGSGSTADKIQNGLETPAEISDETLHTDTNGAELGHPAQHPAQHPAEHHTLIELPDIEVGTGEVFIPVDERAEIEAEAPLIARPVEEISEDRSWLSHRLLNVRTIFSFVLAFGIIIFIFTRLDIDIAKTWRTMLTANPLFFVTGFVVYYSAFWLRGARWKQLLNNVGFDKQQAKLPSINGLVEIIYLSWFVNSIVPAKLGDAYRSYLLKRNSGISFSSTIGTILAERVIDLVVLFGLLSVSFTLVGAKLSQDNGSLGIIMVMGAAMVLGLIVGLIVLRYFSNSILRFVPHRFKEMFVRFQHGILRSFTRRGLPVLLGYTIVIWLLESGRLFFVAHSLPNTDDITLSAVIFIALLSSLMTTIPATPGGVGLVEGAVIFSLGLFLKDQPDQQLAVSIALLDRLISYWSLVLGGLVLYLISKRK